ncbi:MAG: hypothetical protein AAF698_03020 [Pseudomonadota bacterium]
MLSGWAFTVVTVAVIAAGIGVGITRLRLKERHGYASGKRRIGAPATETLPPRVTLIDCYRAGSRDLVILHVALTVLVYGLLAWLAASLLTGHTGHPTPTN